MGAHIVKRRPPVRPPQPAALRRTAELTERQLDELIFDQAHDRAEHAHDELEAELEFVDSLPKVLPQGTPVRLPSTSSLRFARTLRREIGSVPPSIAAMQARPATDGPRTLAASDMPKWSRLSGDGLSAGRALLMFLALFLLTLGTLSVLRP